MPVLGTRIRLVGAAALAAASLYSAPAAAQATRTWVSGVGDDANPCSRTAPCKTFAGAISKTAAGGEINCIDPGAYGAVTITKAIAISCDYVEAGVLATGTNGITINAGANDAVFLNGLDIHGGGSGFNGVRFLAGGSLHIQDTIIRAFNGANATGVLFAPSGAATLTITDTTIANNGNGATSAGVLIQPSGTGSARATLSGVNVQNNAGSGVKVDTTGNTGTGVQLAIRDSQINGSSVGLSLVTPGGAAPASASVDTTSLTNHSVALLANGATAVIRVGNSTLFANSVGANAAGGGAVRSYGNNLTDGNGAAVTFTPPTLVPN